MTGTIDKRIVLHFPGFEPMDAQAHHDRFCRTALQSAKVWGYAAAIEPFAGSGADFSVVGEGEGWRTSNRIHICDHNAIVERLAAPPVYRRILSGFHSATRVVLQGGLAGYFRHAWRFGLFFLFPFFLMALILATCLTVAAWPWWTDFPWWNYFWSLPLAWALFRFLFLPFSERFHTLHLFADWQLAVAAGSLNDADLDRWIENSADTMAKALVEDADEYVISSHSMGSALAVHVLGLVLERNPQALAGRRVVFVTLGGAVLQCALLRPAIRLRQRVGMIARAKEVTWLEVQCLTDAIHFYKSHVVSLSGHPDAPQAELLSIRVRHLLSPERYRRIKRDMLRVHRQYVLHADLRGSFDFTLLAVGPFPADLTSDYSKRDFNLAAQPADE